MPEWTSDELNKIGTAEELEIASLRQVIKNLSMPFWGLNRFWRSRQVFPESFHGSEFFLNRHFV